MSKDEAMKPATAATKLALLIDGDNISATYMPLIMREAEKPWAPSPSAASTASSRAAR